MEKNSVSESLSIILLNVRDKYPNFKYTQEGPTFTISEKGWFGKRLYRGVIEPNGRITIDALDQDSSLHNKDYGSSKASPVNSPKRIVDSVEVGNFLEEQFVKIFHRQVVFNMIRKVN